MDLEKFFGKDLLDNVTSSIEQQPIQPVFDKPGISMQDAVSSTEDYMRNVYNETLYIICERKNFRTDAFLAMFSGMFNVKNIYTSIEGIPQIELPLGFLIDVNFTDQRILQQVLIYIQDVAYAKNRHIFLIGEPDELDIAKAFITRKDISVIKFARPIDVKQCTDEIKNTLTTPPSIKRQKTVICCDDSEIYLKILKKNLEPHYKVYTARSAFDLITILAKHFSPPENSAPDMFIIDYLMPVIDGMTLVKAIKEKDEYKDVPVVFYTGNTDVDEMIKVMPLVDGYILKDKPVTRLEDDLEGILKKKKEERKSKKEKKKKKEEKKKNKAKTTLKYDDKGLKDENGKYVPYNYA